MKIVNCERFLAMPAGTVFTKYEPCNFGDLRIKGDTTQAGNDFWSQELCGPVDSISSEDFVDKLYAAVENGCDVALDFDNEDRDGLYEAGQLFAVWSAADVTALIERLQRALAAYPAGGA
ncbi:hypothetical protein ABWU93_11415 [Xanthomonas translucens pv. translucens]|uniref:hypothetical protein n=1 Tax=Xanthomonas campestris pv. translucens TaxID=343 RepID=UPI003F71D186